MFNGSTTVSPGSPVTIPTQGSSSFEFETTVLGGGNGRLDINILNDAGEQVTVGVDWDNNGQVYVERGQTNGFSNRYFTNDFSMQESNDDNTITLHVYAEEHLAKITQSETGIRYRIRHRLSEVKVRSAGPDEMRRPHLRVGRRSTSAGNARSSWLTSQAPHLGR